MPHLIALLAMVMFPTLAQGADVMLEASASIEYDDNVFRVAEGLPKQSDFVFRLGPRVVFSERTQKFDSQVFWRLPYEKGIRTHQINDFDQFVGGRFRYRLSDKTGITGSNNFAYLRSLAKVRDEVELEDATTVLEISKQTERNYRNNASLGISHQFTSDLGGSLTLGHSFFDTTRRDRRQVQTLSASGNLSYAVDSKNRVGAGLSFTRQDFDDLPGSPGSETMIYRIFASWVYRFDETLSFSVRAGPTLLDNNQKAADQVVLANSEVPFVEWSDPLLVVSPINSCGVLVGTSSQVIPWNRALCDPENAQWVYRDDPAQTALFNAIRAKEAEGPFPLTDPDPPGSESGQRVDIFANATLTKRWSPRLSSSLSYQRSESNASGLGGTAILDAVAAATSWRATELWNVGARLDWTKRSSAFPSTQTFREVVLWDDTPEIEAFGVAMHSGNLLTRTVEEDIDTQRWGVGARLARKISRNANATLRLTYNRQRSKSGTSGESSDFNNFLAIVGFQYRFDRIALW